MRQIDELLPDVVEGPKRSCLHDRRKLVLVHYERI